VRHSRGAWLLLSLFLIGAPVEVLGQRVIAAKAGLVHFAWGEVYLGSERLSRTVSQFPKLNPGETLRTGRGRAEVVLNAGRMLRLDGDSELEILSDDLEKIELRLIRGSAYLEWDWSVSGEPIRVRAGDAAVEIRGHGLYRWDAHRETAAVLKVYDGKAYVDSSRGTETVKSDRSLDLEKLPGRVEKFDPDQRDRFDRWNERRSREIARMNKPAERRIGLKGRDRGTTSAEEPGIPRFGGRY
jgi:hypothetical protein